MRFFGVMLALAGLQTLVVAQSVDPSTVPRATRDSWCRSQRSSCPLLCAQQPGQSTSTLANECDSATLSYRCVCQSGLSPNASEFSETIPYYVCTEANNQCVNRCGGNSACQSACRERNPCGAQGPTRVNTSTISSSMSATASGASGSATQSGSATTLFTGFGGSPTASATGRANGAAGSVALELGKSYGLGLVAAGIFAGFALVL